MAVIRTIKNENYTTMCNTHLRDKNLSLKAKGLLSMMLSLPDKWHYSVKGLEGICKESKNTINSVLNELEDNNYLVRRRRYCNGKISEWEYIIFENNENHDEELLHLKNEDIENEDIEIQDIENRDVYKITKELNTKELNTNEYKEKNIKKESVNSVISSYTENKDLQDALHDFVDMRTKARKPLTARAMKLSLNELDKLAVDDVTKIAIVNQSIVHSWLTFYKLQNNNNGGQRQLTRKEMGYAF
jgi:hypothetical protein|nr:MAG TPA: Dna polymerase B [Bacteriophage sp.]